MFFARLSLMIAALMAVAPAVAAEIGVIHSASGPLAVLGNQIRQGAELAARRLNLADIVYADDGCTAEGGARAAREMAARQVRVVVGFLCSEAIEAAMPVLKSAGIAVVTPAVRTDSLTDNRSRTGWPVFRLAPRADGERAAAAELLIPRWRQDLFALADDGTIYGRELIEAFRLASEQAGLRAVFVDTYRPQMENQVALAARLRRAGATHVLIGGDKQDVAVLARDAAGLGFNLVVAGGEALRSGQADVPLQAGVLMVGLPEWSEIATPAALEDFSRAKIVPEGYALPAYAALQVAAAALKAAGAGPVAERLQATEFATALGAVKFDPKGDLVQSPYRLFRYDGQRFVAVTTP